MKILCLNAGSGTLRHRLFELGPELDITEVDGGMVDRIEGDTVAEAAAHVVTGLAHGEVSAIGVRVVHGGTRYRQATPVDPTLLECLESLTSLAPLHLPTDINVVRAVQQTTSAPCFAVFDTAFHRTLPEAAWRYPLSADLGVGLRRFGFHGLAHQAVSEAFRSAPAEFEHSGQTARVISVHLGGGVSACAIQDGQSVATTMGLTPLEGLMMSTRSGSIDPGLVLELVRQGRSVDEVDRILNRQSGLLGVSGISKDSRDIVPAAQSGSESAELALEMYANRVREAIGAYYVTLGGCDALLISGALVNESSSMRTRLLSGLECLGARLDAARVSAAPDDAPVRLSSDDSTVTIAFIPAEEERQMAREVCRLISGPEPPTSEISVRP